MSEEQIRRLLAGADAAAGGPAFRRVTVAGLQRRVHRRQFIRIAVPTTAAAIVAVAAVLWAFCMQMGRPQPPSRQMASLQERVQQLQVQTEATLKLVQEVLEADRRQRRLASLEAELASIPDPLREIDRQVDKTAFILVYQADKLYNELNETESAVQAYQEVIQLFPTNQWAQVARERLSQIEQRRINKIDRPEGAVPWQAQNT